MYFLSKMAWFSNIEDLTSPEKGDTGQSIFRIIPFDALLQLFNEKKNTIVKTSLWEDSYENFILKENIIYHNKTSKLATIQERLFGQCWTTKQTSDALWRIYSPDRNSVRIKTTVGKLWNTVKDETEGKSAMG